jgi:RHS repeat-associated protein
LAKVLGNTSAYYVYGRDLISRIQGQNIEVFHTDAIGSTRLLTNASGQVTDTYVYDSFGQSLAHNGGSDNSYLYTGEQLDSATDAYYLRARYYQPSTGRFISKDPWEGDREDSRTLDGYQYASNNPIIYVDPSGNNFMLLGLAPDAWYAGLFVSTAVIGLAAINSAEVSIGLGQLAATALQSLTELPGEIIQPSIEQMNQLRERAKEEVNRRKPDLEKLHLIVEPFTYPENTPRSTFIPPLGSPKFIIMENGGTDGRVLGARIAFRDPAARRAPGGNQLIMRIDYHGFDANSPTKLKVNGIDYHGYTVHYHIPPQDNIHNIVWPVQTQI